MFQKYKFVFLLIVLGAVIASVYGYYLYNKPVPGLEHATADFNLTSEELLSAFQSNEDSANSKYLNKVIEITGYIGSAEDQNITLAVAGEFAQVICEMKEGTSLDLLVEGQQVKIKGRCTGYLMDVILVNCNITQ